MKICVAGSGAFGSALALTLAHAGKSVTVFSRSGRCKLPMLDTVSVSSDPNVMSTAQVILIAVPAQRLPDFLKSHKPRLTKAALVACCKGINLETLEGPSAAIRRIAPNAVTAVLTGPSFARDIANGLPTALSLACADDAHGVELQNALSTDTLRLYRTKDVVGAEIGGALKNVIAIGCGAAIGAGLGESARSALLTRGFGEMQTLASHLGAQPDTLLGLSGLGDLTLTSTSNLSRNYCHGLALGGAPTGNALDTVEGIATADATARLAGKLGLDLPVCLAINLVCKQKLSITEAVTRLMTRPLKEE